MKNLKKMLAVLVAVAMIASMAIVPAFAAETFSYESQAKSLNTIGLYKGISETEFVPDLGTSLDRQTGVVMLLRIFGQEDEAKLLTNEQANTILAKFKDAGTIADWAKLQVAYAVDKGFVKGYAEDATFRPAAALNGKAYCSLILQQLGYNGDFQYDAAATKLSEIGGLSAAQAAVYNSNTGIIKDDLVGISFGTLQAKFKADGVKLIKTLIASEVVKVEDVKTAAINYLDIKSVAALTDVTVDIGATPTLPATVKATYEDASTADVSVTWPTVDTSAAGEKTIEGTIADSSVKATVKVIVVPAELKAEAKSLGNLKEIAVVYNRPVPDEDEAEDITNYDIDDHKVKNAELSDDKMTVTLLLNDDDNFDQQEDVTVTLDEDLGFDDDVELTVDNVKDTTSPTVTEVEAVGNGLVKVTFSEPVKSATSLGYYTIDGKLFGSASPDLTDNGKTVSFDLTNRLAASTHKLVVKSKIADYAGFAIETNETEFTVVEDKTAPTGTIKSATQTEVVIEFSEPVEEPDSDDVDTSTSAEITTLDLDDDDMTYTIDFDVDKALPTAGGKITIDDLTDYSGNTVDFEINVTPTYDVTRPEYVGYTIDDDQKQIILEFSEEVLPGTGSFELTDADDDDVDVELYADPDGDAIADSKGYYWDDDNDEYVKTKLVLVRKDGKAFDSEKHELVVSEVADNNPLKNEIMETTVTIDVDDQEDPTVESILCDSANNAIYVEFSEDVDDDTAEALTSYAYALEDEDVTTDLDKDLADVDLLSDGQTVCISFDEDEDDAVDVDEIARLQIDSVTDLASNEMSTVAYTPDSAKWKTSANAPKIVDAKVTDENTIEVKIEGTINEKSLNPDDFAITAGTSEITAWDASYDSDEDYQIVLTVNADIDSDATYGGNVVKLALQAADDVDTVDAFEQELTIVAAIPVDDAYAPTADTDSDSVVAEVYNNSTQTAVYIELSEALDLTSGAQLNATDKNQFKIKADGDTVAKTIYYYAPGTDNKDTDVDESKARFVIIINDNYEDDDVQVMFYANDTATIVDDSGNGLEDFSVTENVD